MFSASRKAVLHASAWRNKGGDVDFIEAWQYENIGEVSDENFRYGTLEDDEIPRWIMNSDMNLAPKSKHTIVGKLRILICERSSYEPMDFPMSVDIFEKMETEFRLHPSTLSIFESHAGTFSRYLTFCETDRTKLKHLAIVLKAPQKREIANYGLSLSHDVESHTTTALIYGAEVLNRPQNQDKAQMYNLKPRMYNWPYSPSFGVPELLDLIRSVPHTWSHPLILPSLLLSHHMFRTRAYVNHGAADETVAIEGELGVTKVGQKYSHPPISDRKGPDIRFRAEELTSRINTHSTRILFTSRSPDWNLKGTQFVLNLLVYLEPYLPDLIGTHHELRDLLETNIGFADAAVDDIKNISSRMALQLNVLYNFIAQADNALNAQLAASAGRDSTSMKILAFISALFLPGSFVAAIFSMSMFDWQHGGGAGDSGNRVVSGRFWIFWVIAVPLTMITLLGWGFWWRLEMKRYKEVFRDVMGETGVKKVEPKKRAIDLESKMPQQMDTMEPRREAFTAYRKNWDTSRMS